MVGFELFSRKQAQPHLQSVLLRLFFEDGVSWTPCPGCPWTMSLPISASQISRITGMSHQAQVLIFGGSGIWTQDLCLLGRHSTAWAARQLHSISFLVILHVRLGLALHMWLVSWHLSLKSFSLVRRRNNFPNLLFVVLLEIKKATIKTVLLSSLM
jgi:hypothetical protein